MNKELTELVRLANRFPNLKKEEIKSYIHLQNILDDELEENSELKTRNYELLKESELWYNQRNKYKQALKLIKEKEVIDIEILKESKNFKDYNITLCLRYRNVGRCLIPPQLKTQEEYNLLKEVLLWID